MRFPVAFGLFLSVAGCMVLVLHPVYDTGKRVPYQGVEATGPVEVYRPVPGWLGGMAIVIGGALLVSSRNRRH